MIFLPSHRERAIIYMDKLFEKKRSVKIDLVTESKTISQNNYCWLVFTCIGQDTGNSAEDIYQFCLSKFAPRKDINVNGSDDLIIVTLSQMTKEQTSRFIDLLVMHWRAEGFEIPEPSTKECIELYNEYKQKGYI